MAPSLYLSQAGERFFILDISLVFQGTLYREWPLYNVEAMV